MVPSTTHGKSMYPNGVPPEQATPLPEIRVHPSRAKLALAAEPSWVLNPMEEGATASLRYRGSADMMLYNSGSTLQNVSTRLIHFRIGGLVSRTQKSPLPFLTKNSWRASYSLVKATEMMPSLTTVEQPVTGIPHEFSWVTRTFGIFQVA